APTRVLPFGDGTALVLMNARNSFDEVRLRVGALAAVSVDIEVFYAIAIPKRRATIVQEVPTASGGAAASGDTEGVTCVPVIAPCEVVGTDNVISDDLDAFALLSLPLGLGSSGWIDVDLSSTQTERTKSGFVIEDAGGLLSSLSGLTLTTYNGGEVQRSVSGTTALDVKDLGDGRSFVYMRTRRPFDRIRITVSGLLASTVQLRVYHAQMQYRTTAAAAAQAPASEASASVATPPEALVAPAPLALSAPAPNPAVGASRVTLTAETPQAVRVRIVDVAGREVAVPFEGRVEPGTTDIRLDAAALPSGVYMVLAEGDGARAMQRMTVVR
ncbi:MAG: T9SS type A sorting domain-containing protein, partial [Bacteroidota bacterium]